ncbi:MAG: undecaprenyl-diphosphate phosphatase [Bacteroidales bacterium]|jgi:undecaprenyl-diphosphatase
MSFLQAIIVAIVQGLTEFLPISSTGHMIITQSLLGIPSTSFVKVFTVSIQFGSILSVVVLYWKRFFQTIDFYYKLFVAFIPAAVIGFFLKDYIESLLGNVVVVAFSLLIGGVIFLFIDNLLKNEEEEEKQKISFLSAFVIGIFQSFSMIPGVSRSASTIIGGLTQKLNRKNAAEFSFFLAVPTMFAATVLELSGVYENIRQKDIIVLAIGNIVAFVVAMFAIKFFISIIVKYGFRFFGYYRIIVGTIILILLALGYNLNILD